MSIDIGGIVTKIEQTDILYQDAGQPATMYVRLVTLRVVGLPQGVLSPMFTVPVTDAIQWDNLQVGQTYTVSIAGGSIP